MKQKLRLMAMLWPIYSSFMCAEARAQRPEPSGPVLSGIVSDTAGNPIEGATVGIKGTSAKTQTNEDGYFSLRATPHGTILQVAHLGYQTISTKISADNVGPFRFALIPNENMLEEVEVSTGYQTIPKERATGSFVHIDNELLNRRVSTNILDRLDGITNSLLFNKDGHLMGNRSQLSIRGRSTINGNLSPLIVVDNFPYEGDINNINPNDIDNITVLKDASAASIWGTRAGNGVIVITTKKGAFNQRKQVALNSNLTIGSVPDLFYAPQLSSGEYIEIEKYLFENGRYGAALNTDYTEISPIVEALQHQKDGLINQTEVTELIDRLENSDIRNDLKRFMYRNTINHQHQVNFQGGNNGYKYFLSSGIDRNRGNTVGNGYGRITFSSKNTYDIIADKLTFYTGIDFSNANYQSNTRSYLLPRYPYEKLIDENGNHLAVSDGTLRLSYVKQMEELGLLDWHYRPLSENASNQTRQVNDYRFNTSLNFTPWQGLGLSIHYMYQRTNGHNSTYDGPNSYYARNLVNQFTQIDESGALYRPLAEGGIANNNESQTSASNGRIQFTYNKRFGSIHDIDVLGGAEFRDNSTNSASVALYGFDEDLLTNVNSSLNFLEPYPIIYGNRSSRIPVGVGNGAVRDVNVSYYLAATYRYKSRYTISSSFRRDESNLFGVEANQRGVPLWSVGILWSITDEDFFDVDWLQLLKLRATYGYNGNIDKSTTAYLTAANSGSTNTFGSPIARITNPPNPSLRWERVKNTNIGIDFGLKGNLLSGSIEYYIKNGLDLIGDSPIAPQTGQNVFRGNSASLLTKGIDVALYSRNIDRTFKWQTAVLFNFVQDRITEYQAKSGSNYEIVNANYQNPMVGYPYFSLFAFPFVGLNESGRLIGMLDGDPSTDYVNIRNSANTSNITYIGPASPTVFGSIRNTFMFKNLTLSFNIQYKYGYFYRSPYYLNNTTLFNGTYRNQVGYSDRWKAPGDELRTTVPSLVYPANASHDVLYGLSDIHIQKGDHIRLQDVRFSYSVRPKFFQAIMPTVDVFVYASNLGILWKSSDSWIDPDAVVGTPATEQYALGMNITF
ncbi:SusC/RagA family TonB-linked outer membrane protein [Parapedobacter sp. DT-150]|uniref:SusC/RagA family TonB-linked outer membrane protein n=1 Tax=Parapedobacter sp. DT-150 TaxID=3396162 RepID=UPI003F1C3B7F